MPDAAVAAVFDLGGVLIDWDPRVAYHAAFPNAPDLVDRFLRTTLTEIGLATCEIPGQLDEIVSPWRKQRGEFAPLIDFFAAEWPLFVRGTIEETVVQVERLLVKDVPIFGLTNWPEATFPPPGPEFGFLDRFRDIVVSGHEGMRKPGGEIFRLAIDRFGVNPHQTVYVDDHPGNVETATRMGFRTLHLKEPTDLEKFLVDNGLL